MITRTKGVVSGAYVLKGTRIPVKSIQGLSDRNLSPERIQSLYPQLTLEQVHAALSFRKESHA